LSRDRAIGGLLLAGGIIGIIIYGYVLYLYPLILLQITAFIAVAAVLAILAWIGYTMATTPGVEPMTAEPTVAPTPPAASIKPEEKKE
jgi:predicted DNA-binding transcriptional regulator